MEEVGKRNKVKVVLVSAICLGLIIIVLYSFYIWNTQGVNPIEQASLIFNKANNEHYEGPETQDENTGSLPGDGDSGAEAGGSGGGSSGEGNENPLTGCAISSIMYSLELINKEEVCNVYDGEVCIDKTISCSAEIHNGDPSSDGIFVMELSFVENEKSIGEAIEKRTKNLIIPPEGFEVFSESLTIQSTGADGVANKIINCYYDPLGSPKKEVC